jgi:hypothetical protein
VRANRIEHALTHPRNRHPTSREAGVLLVLLAARSCFLKSLRDSLTRWQR